MTQELEALLSLHKLDKSIVLQSKQLSNIDKSIANIDLALSGLSEKIESSKKTLDENKKSTNKKEMELAELESKISKYKEQLFSVKTNKEYQAILSEINTLEKQNSSTEDEELELLDSKDGLEKSYMEAKKELEKEEKKLQKAKGKLLKERDGVVKNIKSLSTKKEAIYPTLPTQLFKEYDRLIKKRHGVAIVSVVDEICTGCHMKLTPQMFQKVRKNTEIVRCSQCSRFVFYEQEKEKEEE